MIASQRSLHAYPFEDVKVTEVERDLVLACKVCFLTQKLGEEEFDECRVHRSEVRDLCLPYLQGASQSPAISGRIRSSGAAS